MKGSGMGGQAVLEGVMMRNGGKYAVAVRKPDNDIDVVIGNYESISEKNNFFKLPFIRGIVRFFEEVYLGLKHFSAAGEYYNKDEESNKTGDDGRNLQLLIVIAVISLAIGIFIALPYVLSIGIGRLVTSDLMLTIIEGAVRLVFLILFAIGISLLPDVKRLYMYIGAEHKVMNCLDKGLPVTVSNVRKMGRKNYNCGTVFVINVIIISIVLFMFIRLDNILLRVLFRLLLFPVVAGLTYEVMKLASQGKNSLAVIFNLPGILVHGLTTDEPADEMIEVAVESALAVCGNEKPVIKAEKEEQDETENIADKKVEKLKSGIKRVSKERLARTGKDIKIEKSKEQNPVPVEDENKEITRIPPKKAQPKQMVEDDDDEILNALNHFFNSKKEEGKLKRGKRK